MNKILPLCKDIINIIGKYNLPTKENIKTMRDFNITFSLKFHLRYIKYNLDKYKHSYYLYKITRVKYITEPIKRYQYAWTLLKI
jgi:hypothetical protein